MNRSKMLKIMLKYFPGPEKELPEFLLKYETNFCFTSAEVGGHS